ncbi:MAG: tetratricopeptide repeat protein [Candidatus Helarchaeota archaeon]
MGKSNIIEIKEKIESYLRAGNLKKASKEIKSAEKKFLDEPYLIFYKGMINWNSKQYEDAIANFKECLKSALLEEGQGIYAEFKKGQVYYYMGLCYDMLGNTEEAIIQIKKALHEEPTNFEYQEMLDELQAEL